MFILPESVLLPTHSDGSIAGLNECKHDENTVYNIKPYITCKSQDQLYGNMNNGHTCISMFGLSKTILKMICSQIRALATTPFVSNIFYYFFEFVSISFNFCSSLLETKYYNRFSINIKVSEAGHLPYGHNVTIWGNEMIYGHLSIVIMEDQPLVIESALFIFRKYSTVSSLFLCDRGSLQMLKGSRSRLTRHSWVLLVGHGSKGSDGVAKLSGYGPEELARIIAAMEREDEHFAFLSLVACKLGKDLHFSVRLLIALRSFNINTKLQLQSSILSVSPNGELMTKEEGVWRQQDESKTRIVQLDEKGNLLTKMMEGKRGKIIPDYQGQGLYLHTLQWPTHPQMFVPDNLRKKYPYIDCLEGLTWSLFFEENERRRAPDYITDKQRPLEAVWLTGQESQPTNIPIKHITSILDLLVEIRYNAREDSDFDLYYVLNDCIYKVDRKTFNTSFAGKFMEPNKPDNIKQMLSFSELKEHYSLRELRLGLKASKFNDFCRQTFQLQQCVHNCERWGSYFMAAVFSASVRNFRIFSLFLMSVIACEVGRSQGSDSLLCTAFVGEDHPMSTDDPVPEFGRRGFYGCTLSMPEEMTKQDRLVWVDEVVAKENALFTKSKQLMNSVDHDQETELNIFGKVKVMNKYVFSSYLEFFRGTPEGKKLKRGCVSFPSENNKW